MTEKLTKDELQMLINIVSQVQVSVAQSPPLIDLINKMSRMIDEAKKNGLINQQNTLTPSITSVLKESHDN